MTGESVHRGLRSWDMGKAQDPSDRFQDPAWRLWRFAQEILVSCVRCGGRAVVVVHPDHRERHRYAIGLLMAPHRLSCPGCGHSKDWLPRLARASDRHVSGGRAVPHLSGPDDPFFGFPLWLQRSCCGGRVFWAYNLAHLELVEGYVRARHRERGSWTGSGSLVERLPTWIKAASNRDEILAAIQQLRAR
jgi:hypothetical protein